jgi:hypothetical protein
METVPARTPDARVQMAMIALNKADDAIDKLHLLLARQWIREAARALELTRGEMLLLQVPGKTSDLTDEAVLDLLRAEGMRARAEDVQRFRAWLDLYDGGRAPRSLRYWREAALLWMGQG